jgi:hypothetical protein
VKQREDGHCAQSSTQTDRDCTLTLEVGAMTDRELKKFAEAGALALHWYQRKDGTVDASILCEYGLIGVEAGKLVAVARAFNGTFHKREFVDPELPTLAVVMRPLRKGAELPRETVAALKWHLGIDVAPAVFAPRDVRKK